MLQSPASNLMPLPISFLNLQLESNFNSLSQKFTFKIQPVDAIFGNAPFYHFVTSFYSRTDICFPQNESNDYLIALIQNQYTAILQDNLSNKEKLLIG